jgi:lipoprotein-anchoring transpeptidase ErfK/SrfK
VLGAVVAVALVVVGAAMLAAVGDPAGPLPGAGTALAAALPVARPAPAPAAAPAAVPIAAVVPAAVAPRPAAAPAAAPAPAGGSGGQTTKGPSSTAAPKSSPRTTTPAAKGALVAGTPCTTTARACVDVLGRRAWLLGNGAVTRGPVHIMTGDQDDPTPIGTFRVQWKAEEYTSRQYLVQMPYSVFFADGGIAFHEGRQDTASGGCVKLGHDDAVAWFAYLQVGDEVQIH